MSRHRRAAEPPITMASVPQESLALMAQATAEQHRAILALQELFASRGGIVSQHQITAERPEHTIKELEECRSFAVVNFSAVTLQAGWGGRLAVAGGATPIPAQSFLQIPTDCNNCEVAAAAGDLVGGVVAGFLFIRYRHLAPLAAGPLNSSASGASTREAVSIVTATSPRKVAVGAASTPVLAANPERKGLLVTNTGAAKVSLGLGAAAVLSDDIVLEPGGSWGGTISGVLWRGAVNAIAAAEQSLAVVEV